jgi:hypothetical protein
MKEILDYINLLREQSFAGWDDQATAGYLTALTSLEEFVKNKKQ